MYETITLSSKLRRCSITTLLDSSVFTHLLADAEAMSATSDALVAKAAAAADPASLKHIVLDAGDKGAVKLTARSWMDGVRQKLDAPKQQGCKV